MVTAAAVILSLAISGFLAAAPGPQPVITGSGRLSPTPIMLVTGAVGCDTERSLVAVGPGTVER